MFVPKNPVVRRFGRQIREYNPGRLTTLLSRNPRVSSIGSFHLVFTGKKIVDHIGELNNLIGHSAMKRSIARLIIDPNVILSVNMGDDKFSEGLLDRKSGYACLRRTTRTPESPYMIHFNQTD